MMAATVAEAQDGGPGCGHSMCLFERDCLIIQAEFELDEARADRIERREAGRGRANVFGLSEGEGPLFEVILYSSDLAQRIRAGERLCLALQRIAVGKAA